eukprot:6202651-Pleurochrysis_carterae.AAC.2
MLSLAERRCAQPRAVAAVCARRTHAHVRVHIHAAAEARMSNRARISPARISPARISPARISPARARASPPRARASQARARPLLCARASTHAPTHTRRTLSQCERCSEYIDR